MNITKTPLIVLAMLTACSPAPVPDAAPAAAGVPAEVAGPIVSAMDTTADPCEDFYQYACGGWLEATELPNDRARYVRSFDVIRRENLDTMRELLEANPSDLAGRYYATCMDTDAIAGRGLEPLEALAPKPPEPAPGIADPPSYALGHRVGQYHTMGVRVLMGFWISPDPKNPEVYIAHANQGGLGLSDRSYYLEERRADLLAAYQATITGVFEDLGKPQAAMRAADVVALEKALATIQKPRAELRDPDKTYHPTPLAELPWGDLWRGYLAGRGAEEVALVNLRNPEYFAALEEAVSGVSSEALEDYLLWHTIRMAHEGLSPEIGERVFAFYGQRLGGQKERQSRWERCVSMTDQALGEQLGQLYVASSFSGSSRPKAQKMVDDIAATFLANLPDIDWMDAPTRAAASRKLGTLLPKIGHPTVWRDYAGVEVEPGAYLEAMVSTRRYSANWNLSKHGEPVDHSEWYMSPPTVNAYYTPFGNQIVFPAGILQAPFFDDAFPAAVNYGGIGMVIGHEITHGFDDGGRKFDDQGKLRQWWTDEAAAAFVERAACVERSYSAIEARPGEFIDGKLTLGENIADIGGIKLALGGYHRDLADRGATGATIGPVSGDQLFFVAFAQGWCAQTAPGEESRRLVTDSHSPPRWRVNGALRHVPEFAETFSCAADAAMRAEETCQVW